MQPFDIKSFAKVLLGLVTATAMAIAIVNTQARAEPAKWTGCWVGAHVGAAATSNDVAGISVLSSEGAIGGLGAGCDVKLANSPFLVGIGAGYTWGDLSAVLGAGPGAPSMAIEGAWDVVARVGILPTDKLLVYVLGGVKQAKVSSNVGLPDKFDGYVAGAGVEAAISQAFRAKLEYRTDMLNHESLGGGVNLEPRGHEIRLGLVWAFAAPTVTDVFNPPPPEQPAPAAADPKMPKAKK